MTVLTNNQQEIMETLAAQFNSEYPYEYAHKNDISKKWLPIRQLRDFGLVEELEDNTTFVRLTAKGLEMIGLTVATMGVEAEPVAKVVDGLAVSPETAKG